MPDTENEELIAEAQSMVGDVPEQVEAIVLSMIFQRHYIQPSGDVDNNDECVCGGWSSGAMEPGWDDHLGEVAVEAGFRLASRPPVPLTPHPALEDLERAIHAGMAPNLMTIAGAIGSQEHYNEFLRGIAVSVAALLKGGSDA